MTEEMKMEDRSWGKPYVVKLVRDEIGQHLADDHVTYEPAEKHLTPEERVKKLRAKLVDEALEYAMDPSAEEAGDVLAVLHALAEVDLGVSWQTIEATEAQKYSERGGFYNGTVMVCQTTAEED